jgi:hypothetical protein
MTTATYLLAAAKRARGDPEGCRTWLDRARGAYEDGQIEEAEAHYLRAIDFYRRLGHVDRWVSELNLGLLRVLGGRRAEAGPRLEEVRATFLERGQQHYPPTVSLAPSAVAAAAARLSEPHDPALAARARGFAAAQRMG